MDVCFHLYRYIGIELLGHMVGLILMLQETERMDFLVFSPPNSICLKVKSNKGKSEDTGGSR